MLTILELQGHCRLSLGLGISIFKDYFAPQLEQKHRKDNVTLYTQTYTHTHKYIPCEKECKLLVTMIYSYVLSMSLSLWQQMGEEIENECARSFF